MLKKAERGCYEKVPLCVDLDGTLILGDSSVEAFKRCVVRQPWVLFVVWFWLLRSVSYLKRCCVAYAAPVSEIRWVYSVVSYLKSEFKLGREIYLATGARVEIANQIAHELGCFDGVFATSGEVNLVSKNKARVLVEAFGVGGFDYIGNSRQDLAVWECSRKGMVVNARASLLKRALKMENVHRFEDVSGFVDEVKS